MKRLRIAERGLWIGPTAVFVVALALNIVAAPLGAEAQQAARIPLIGYLSASFPAPVPRDAFRQGLRDLGYLEGRTIAIEYRWAEGRYDRLSELATQLVRLKVDVILANNTAAALAAKHATQRIPIVVAAAGADPVHDQLVTSLGRPGENLTGLSLLAAELNGKRLQLLKEVLPGLVRVAVLWNPNNPTNAASLRDTEIAAQSLGVSLHSLEVRGPNDLEGAVQAATKGSARALVTVPDPMFFSSRRASRNLR